MNSCNTCDYLEKRKDASVCRRYPPTVSIIPVVHPISRQPGLQNATSFPVITSDVGGCGEWMRKLNLIAERE